MARERGIKRKGIGAMQEAGLTPAQAKNLELDRLMHEQGMNKRGRALLERLARMNIETGYGVPVPKL